jgi:DNA-binding protein
MQLLKTYVTTLEGCGQLDVQTILNRKAEAVGSNATADYISRAIDNLNITKQRLKDYKSEISTAEKSLNNQEKMIMCEVAKWLEDNGVERIDGDIISSITIANKAPSHEVIIEDETMLDVTFFKLVVDKTAVKKALLDGDILAGARLETAHNEQTIKLNKKRLKVSEDEAIITAE